MFVDESKMSEKEKEDEAARHAKYYEELMKEISFVQDDNQAFIFPANFDIDLQADYFDEF